MQNTVFEAIRVYENLKKDKKSRGIYEIAVSALMLSIAILLLAVVTILLLINFNLTMIFPLLSRLLCKAMYNL